MQYFNLGYRTDTRDRYLWVSEIFVVEGTKRQNWLHHVKGQILRGYWEWRLETILKIIYQVDVLSWKTCAGAFRMFSLVYWTWTLIFNLFLNTFHLSVMATILLTFVLVFFFLVFFWTHRPLGGWSYRFAAVRPFARSLVTSFPRKLIIGFLWFFASS